MYYIVLFQGLKNDDKREVYYSSQLRYLWSFLGIQNYMWTGEVYTAMTSHCDKPEVLCAACHALRELIDVCPDVLDEIGDEPSDSTIPLHRCSMAALVLHMDDPELCESACRVLASIVNNSSSLREVIMQNILIQQQQHVYLPVLTYFNLFNVITRAVIKF